MMPFKLFFIIIFLLSSSSHHVFSTLCCEKWDGTKSEGGSTISLHADSVNDSKAALPESNNIWKGITVNCAPVLKIIRNSGACRLRICRRWPWRSCALWWIPNVLLTPPRSRCGKVAVPAVSGVDSGEWRLRMTTRDAHFFRNTVCRKVPLMGARTWQA